MRFLKFALPMLAVLCFAGALKAEDTPNPDAPKTEDAKPAETKTDESPAPVTKLADNGELPSAPTGNATAASSSASDTLTGDISKGAPTGKAKKKKKGGSGDSSTLTLAVAHPKGKEAKKAKKEGKTPKTVTLLASGDVLSQLNAFADKHAHVKVTGTLSGDSMTVKEVTEVEADKKKKKNKNNA